MTAHEEQQIRLLQAQGFGYKRIASELGLSINTIKSYCRRHLTNESPAECQSGCCKNCGAEIKQLPNRKTKKFCSDKCRSAWWMKYTEKHKTDTQQEIKCLLCGKTFICYPSRKKKYCSRECYYNARQRRCNS